MFTSSGIQTILGSPAEACVCIQSKKFSSVCGLLSCPGTVRISVSVKGCVRKARWRDFQQSLDIYFQGQECRPSE